MTRSVLTWLLLALLFAIIGGGLWIVGNDYLPFLQWLGACVEGCAFFCLMFAFDEFERPVD